MHWSHVPPTRVRRASEKRTPRHIAFAGQSLVIFALASTVLMAALGLALDVGYNVGQRRTLQNAADAAALKGAHNVFANATTPVTTTAADVRTIALANGFPDSADAELTCSFVGNPNPATGVATDLGPCSGPIPAAATGARVTMKERHATFVMGVLGISTSGTGAAAVAHVQTLAPETYTAIAGPFIVCGYKTKLAAGVADTDGTIDGYYSILKTDGAGIAQRDTNGLPIIQNDPGNSAFGKKFVIHDPQVSQCNTQGARFKGVNLQIDNVVIPPGGSQIIQYDPGDVVRPVNQAVNAIGGCAVGATTDCIMMIPLAENASVDCGTCQNIRVVGWAAFKVTTPDNGNTHYGELLPLEIQASGTFTWTRGQSVVVIRLTQ